MDLSSIISYNPHPHLSIFTSSSINLHVFIYIYRKEEEKKEEKKTSLSFCSLSCHALLVIPSRCSCLLPCLRQFWSQPSTSESTQEDWWRDVVAVCSLRGTQSDAHSVWLRDLAKIVVGRGHTTWCPAYVTSEQALLNTSEVTRSAAVQYLLRMVAR